MTEFPRNTLGDEDSPYLLQHAGNPVAWQPWGEEAFARAKRENLPVFLSIGYSTCHWCHVMEHESFENQRIAEFLNRHFVSIKVDREERPDVDMTYMSYVQATTGHGGWPMTVFLTPEGLPFFGGTYFPPDDRHGRTGFLNLLARIHELWSARPADLTESARSALAQLRLATASDKGEGEELPEAGKLARAGTAVFARQFDTGYAGFGNAPKFPRPAAPTFLLEVARRWPTTEHGREALGMASATLLAMADGGIHDHLGGGFHRYAVDRIWHIPHYEKMLYDQAQIAPLYLEMARLTGNPAMGAVAEGIFSYVMRDLSHPEGGFYGAEDADSLPESGAKAKREGAFYVFTAEELGRVLDPEALQIFAAAYGVLAEGNVDPNSDPHGELEGTNTLYRASGLAKLAEKFGHSLPELHRLLEEAKAKVLAYRSSRPRPHRDEKIVLGWNGLMIGAMATGGRVLGRTDWIERAEKAARFVLEHLREANTGDYFRSVHTRTPVVKAFASDLTQWVSGLLDLHAATGKLEWLLVALEAQEQLDRRHRDEEDGCYFSARDDGGLHVLSLKEDHDGAEPSPNSLGAVNLLRLARLTGDESFALAARRILIAHAGGLATAPHVAPMLAVAALRFDHDGGQAVLSPADQPGAAALAEALGRIAPPGLAIIHLPGSGPERDWWLARHPWMAGLSGEGGVPTVHLCREQTCGLPITEPNALAALLA